MAKRKVAAEGVIIVNFPPPVPGDLDSKLKWAVEDLLGGAGEGHAASEPDDNGWGFDIRIWEPSATTEWAERLVTFLRKKKVPRTSVIEVSVRTGPMEVSVYAKDNGHADLSPLLPSETAKAWADV